MSLGLAYVQWAWFIGYREEQYTTGYSVTRQVIGDKWIVVQMQQGVPSPLMAQSTFVYRNTMKKSGNANLFQQLSYPGDKWYKSFGMEVIQEIRDEQHCVIWPIRRTSFNIGILLQLLLDFERLELNMDKTVLNSLSLKSILSSRVLLSSLSISSPLLAGGYPLLRYCFSSS